MNQQLEAKDQSAIQQLGMEEQMFNPPQPDPQEPPQTIVIECNKQHAVADGFELEANEWTNRFPAVKLKKGDLVSVNSAFLSSRGSGDLLQFDIGNNKTRVVFEYYCSNDGANGKRPAYNMKGDFSGVPDAYNVSFDKDGGATDVGRIPCFPNDYRPMRMYRLMKTFGTVLPNRLNVAPFNAITNPTPTPPYNGSQLIPFTDPTTNPSTALMEANWGYNIASNEINQGLEDDYVPGLLRSPEINLRETIIRMGNPTPNPDNPTATPPNYWGHNFDQARMWYISTPRSQLSPAGGATLNPPVDGRIPLHCMRIHFAYGTNIPAAMRTDSLNLVKSLRPGMVIKFIDPDHWGGLRTPSYVLDGDATGGQPLYIVPGSGAYYCSGYVSENQGYNPTCDKFTQIGNLEDWEQQIHQPSWIGSPLQGFFKISRVYINATRTNPGGNNNGNTLDFCPYIEVMGNTSISLAWGNPNINMPGNKPDITATTLTNGTANYKYNWLPANISPGNCAFLRSWIGESTAMCRRPSEQGRGSYKNDRAWNDGNLTAASPNITFAGGLPMAVQDDPTGFADALKLIGRGIGDGNGQFASRTIPQDAVVIDVRNGDGSLYTQNAGAKIIVMSKPATTTQTNHQIWIFTRERECFRDSQNPNIFPETVGEKDKFYMGFKPSYHNNKDATGVDSIQNTGIFSEKYAEQYDDMVGALTTNPTTFKASAGHIDGVWGRQAMDVINYNFLTLGKDGSYNNPEGDATKLKYGKDYFTDLDDRSELYSGGRLPNWFNRDAPNIDDSYDSTNIMSCIRTLSTNLGAYSDNCENRSFNNLEQNDANTTTDQSYLNGGARTANPGWVNVGDPGSINRGMDYFPFNNPAPNQSGWFLEGSTKGIPAKFYFSLPIASTPRAKLGYTGMNLPNVPFAERGLLAELVDMNQPYFADGVVNFLGGTANFYESRYYNDPYTPDTVKDRGSGHFYGFSGFANGIYYYNDIKYDATKKIDVGTQSGVNYDMRYVACSIEQSFIAKFTNNAGQSEYMAIQLIGNGQFDWNSNETGTNYTINHRKRAFMIEPKNGAYTADEKNQRDCEPGFIIVQRDLANTGAIAFEGNGNQQLSTPGNVATESFCIDKTKTIPNPGSYFEIVDCLASTEHTFQFPNNDRELIPFSAQDITESKLMEDFVNLPAPSGVAPTSAIDGGGQFVLTKIPNMPLVRGGKVKFDDLTIHMIDQNIAQSPGTECIKKPNPTQNNDPNLAPQKAGTTPGHQGHFIWGIHYDYIDLDLSQAGSDVFYSPTDISNLITKQLQEPSNIFNTKAGSGGKRVAGGLLENTKGKYPMNSLYRPINGPNLPGNTEDNFNGCLASVYPEGSFVFFKSYSNAYSVDAKFSFLGHQYAGGRMPLLDTEDTHLNDGVYPVFPGNDSTYVNTAPTTNFTTLTGMGITARYKQKVLYTDSGQLNLQNFDTVDFPTLNACCASQFVGCYKPQLIYNEDVSRFEFQYLHQPVMSEWDTNDASPATEEIVKIWGNSIPRCDNWSRYGGINVVNWCADTGISFNTITSRRGNYINPIDKTQPNKQSQAFMNKLGFSSNWIQQYAGETIYEDTTNDTFPAYKPVGTTDADYNTTASISYAQDQNMKYYRDIVRHDDNTPYGITWTATTALDKLLAKIYMNEDFELSNINGGSKEQFNLEDTAHPPNGWKSDSDSEYRNKSRTTGSSIGYGFPNTFNTPKAWKSKVKGTTASTGQEPHSGHGQTPFTLGSAGKFVITDMNMDDVKFPFHQIAVQSNGLRADLIPSKTDTGYFLIMSDLIDKHEFYGSANGGQPLNCIGILSKNYENNDFYFSFQSPVEFFIKHDKPITSITTRILTPSMETPVGLDMNSSIIYTITRANNIPEPDVPPVPIQQAYDYALQAGIELQMGMPPQPDGNYAGYNGNFMGITNAGNPNGSGGGGGSIRNALTTLGSARQSLIQSVLRPDGSTSGAIAGYHTELAQNLGRLSMRDRIAMARAGYQTDDSTPDSIEAGASEVDSIMPPPQLLQGDLGLSEQELQELEVFEYAPVAGGKKGKGSSGYGGSSGIALGDAPEDFEEEDEMRGGRADSPPPRARRGGGSDINLGDIPTGRERIAEYDRRRKRSQSQEAPDLIGRGEYLAEYEHQMTKEDAVKFSKGIRSGIDWNRMEQIPTGLLRAMGRNRTINNKRLPEADALKAREHLKERTRLLGEGVPESHLLEEATGYTGAGKIPPTQPLQRPKAQGKNKLKDLIDGTMADYLFSHKSENKHDIRTWAKPSLEQWVKHGESAFAEAFAGGNEAIGKAVRERHSRHQTTEADKAYLLTSRSARLISDEYTRRERVDGKGVPALRGHTGLYNKGKPDSRGRKPPKGYNPLNPSKYHRGIEEKEPNRKPNPKDVRVAPSLTKPPPPRAPPGGGFQAGRQLSDQ